MHCFFAMHCAMVARGVAWTDGHRNPAARTVVSSYVPLIAAFAGPADVSSVLAGDTTLVITLAPLSVWNHSPSSLQPDLALPTHDTEKPNSFGDALPLHCAAAA